MSIHKPEKKFDLRSPLCTVLSAWAEVEVNPTGAEFVSPAKIAVRIIKGLHEELALSKYRKDPVPGLPEVMRKNFRKAQREFDVYSYAMTASDFSKPPKRILE